MKNYLKNMSRGQKIAALTLSVAAVAAAPITLGGSLAAAALGIGVGTSSGLLLDLINSLKKVKKGIVILGMQESGKTTIYDFLQGKKNAGVSSNIDDYEEFTFRLKDDRDIVVRKGKDLGGDEGLFDRHYERMIKDPDVDYCFFVFDAFKYINEEDPYRRKVNRRLFLLQKNDILSKNIAIIGSFADKFSSKKLAETKKTLRNIVADKGYSKLFAEDHFYLLNLTSKSNLKKAIVKIFSTDDA